MFKKLFFITSILVLLLFPCFISFAQQLPAFLIPPTEFKAFDTPNDAGETVSLTWSTSPSDAPDVFYIIYIDKDKNGTFEKEAIRIKSNTSYRTSVPEIYGYKKGNGDYHYVQITHKKDK